MSNKTFRRLGSISLAKIFAWCEANDKDPLSDAYINACRAIARVKESSTLGKRAQLLKIGERVDEYVAMWDAAYMCRDTIGRAILSHVKREEKLSNGCPGIGSIRCG